MTEPEIIINGHKLTDGQAMTVRVACNDFAFQLQDRAFREALGQIAIGYQQRLNEIIYLLCETVP